MCQAKVMKYLINKCLFIQKQLFIFATTKKSFMFKSKKISVK